MLSKRNGEKITNMIYDKIKEVYNDEPDVNLDAWNTDDWASVATTAFGYMGETGMISSADMCDLLAYLVDGDELATMDVLENGGITNMLGGRLFAMHNDPC